ncbi:MAG: ABC transporter ATP-binding protein [Ruminiclostridium sp.]|nr:ABC transporter ATP-binding protein [Ruminiclostridium sp.]
MIRTVHRILKFIGKYAGRIRLAYISTFFHSLLMNVPTVAAIYMIDLYLRGQLTVMSCVTAAAAMLVSFVLQAVCKNISDRLQSGTGYRVFADKRKALGEHLRKLPMGYFSEGNIGRISSVLSQDMVFIEEQAMTIVADVVSDIFSAVITTAFMFVLHPLLGAVTLTVEAAVIITAQPCIKRSLGEAADRQAAVEELTSAVLEYSEGLPVIKSYGLTGESAAEMRSAFRKMKTTNLSFEEHIIPFETAHLVLYGIGITALLASAVWLMQNGQLSATYFVGTILFLFSVFSAIKHLYQQTTRLTIMKSCLDRIDEVFAESELADSGTEHFGTDGYNNEIEFRNVTFAYGSEEVLHDISFSAKKGQMTALVGQSGSGKTTIANLLARFWDITGGEILVRGTDIRKVPLSELMDNVSMVFQKVYLFQDTIYNNIAMGRPEATRDEVYEAARKAQCFDFISALPYGFETVIGEGGASLSGGEAQRISIARCILKNSPIIILDEATASIDADNERCIQAAMAELCRDKTTVVIAHRLYTVSGADQILVLDNGKIEERGTRSELLALGGLYSRMEAANA